MSLVPDAFGRCPTPTESLIRRSLPGEVALAMVRGRLGRYVETQVGDGAMLVCWELRRTFYMIVRAESCRWRCRLTPNGALIAYERS